MRQLGNFIWHIPFLGFIDAAFTFVIGIFFVITVVGTPIGLGLIQLSKFLLLPYTSSMVPKSNLNLKENILWQSFGMFVRIFWFPFGLVLSIILLVQIVALFITIIEIPVALVLLKSLSTVWNPVGKVCVRQ